MGLRRTVFGQNKSETSVYTNTFIGGIGLTITSKAALAGVLGIPESYITSFFVYGDNVAANITTPYTQKDYGFEYNNDLTFFYDLDGRMISVGINGFANTDNIYKIFLPGVTSTGSAAFGNVYGGKRISAPKAETLAQTAGYEGVFLNAVSLNIWLPSSLQTANEGVMEGDVQYAVDNGNTVYFLNGTETGAPSAITDLSLTEVTATAAKVNFTVPASATNISFYEVFVNDLFVGEIEAPGDYISGLLPNTTQTVSVIAIDENYKFSPKSNKVSVTTTVLAVPQQEKIIYNAKLDELSGTAVIDSKNGYNGTSFNAAVGQAGILDGAYRFIGSGYISVPDNNDFTFADASADIPFSLRLWVKFSGTGEFMLINKMGSSSGREWHLNAIPGGVQLKLYSGGSSSISIQKDLLFTRKTNVWYHITGTYDGSGIASGISLAVNAVTGGTTSQAGTYSKMTNNSRPVIMGRHGGANVLYLNGYLDDVVLWRGVALTPSEIIDDYNKGKGLAIT